MGDTRIPYTRALSFLKEENEINGELYLSSEKIENLRTRLDQLMKHQKPYLRHHYSLNDLAHDLKLPVYLTSAFINNILQQRFNDLINHYRIAYCLQLLQSQAKPELKVNKLPAACGYSNRNTFTNAFKKFTQRTPLSYISQLKKEVDK